MIHADASSSGESAAGDINNFMEIEIDIVTKDVLTQQVKQAYGDRQEEAQGTTESGMDIGEIARNVLCVLGLAIVTGLCTVTFLKLGGTSGTTLSQVLDKLTYYMAQLV